MQAGRRKTRPLEERLYAGRCPLGVSSSRSRVIHYWNLEILPSNNPQMAFSFTQPVTVVQENAASARSPTDRDRPEVERCRAGPEPWHRPKKLVLCFDGTGNKFHGDDRDSNILKIFRMLDSSSDDQCKLTAP